MTRRATAVWVGTLGVVASASCSFVLDDPIRPPGAEAEAAGGTGGAGPGSGGDASSAGPVTVGSGATGSGATGSSATNAGGASSSAGGTGGAGGDGGGACVDDVGPQSGCADGYREGYNGPTIAEDPPNIAACAGRFDVPGAGAPRTGKPACALVGNDTCQPDQAGCSAADLCATGWHVCNDANELLNAFPDGCLADEGVDLFWMTAIAQDENGNGCGGGNGNVLGCGQLGDGGFDDCKPPFNARMDFQHCQSGGAAAPWLCDDGFTEAGSLRKPGLGGGGVLCCNGAP